MAGEALSARFVSRINHLMGCKEIRPLTATNSTQPVNGNIFKHKIKRKNRLKITLKNISHFDFFNRLETDVKEIENVLELRTYNQCAIKEFADNKVNTIKNFISETISLNSDLVTDLLNDGYANIFDRFYSRYAYGVSSEIEKEIIRLDKFNKSLKQTISYLSIVESLYDSNISIEIKDINEKTDFILNKLNILFSDEFYSIATILELNDIDFRDGETREVAENLKNRGYLILLEEYGLSDKSKISVKGAYYITRKNTQKEKINSKTQLDKRIDNIIDHLEKLGLGQEVIFNEIEELRKLQNKLSKKSWSQLLKGKLIDLALDKIISIDTMSTIYEYLTNNNFKMLK